MAGVHQQAEQPNYLAEGQTLLQILNPSLYLTSTRWICILDRVLMKLEAKLDDLQGVAVWPLSPS